MSKKTKWGIIGLGKIAQTFADDLKLVPDAELTAVASRFLDKAKDFATSNGALRAYGSYTELFKDPEIEVVYIATPHTEHKDNAILGMNHGKNILCEKPMGISADQEKEMIASARKNKVFLMEALWSRFNPAIREIKDRVMEGDIGEIAYLKADFAFPALDRDEKGRLLNPELAGGSLLDIGIYPAFLAYLFLGKPKEIHATSRFYKTGVEIQTAFIFEYDHAMALLYSGLSSHSEMRAEISGTAGNFYIQPRWHETSGYVFAQGEEIKEIDKPKIGKGYAHEIIEVQECLKNGEKESKLWSLEDSLNLISLLDKIREMNQIEFPAEK